MPILAYLEPELTIIHPMTPTITAFERSPDGGRGLARDMRVRWALEEVGQLSVTGWANSPVASAFFYRQAPGGNALLM